MASRGMFRLNLFALVLVIFLLVEFNSSEELNRDERSIRVRKEVAGLQQRSFFPIDGKRNSHEWIISENLENVPRLRRSPGKKSGSRVGTLPYGHTRHVPPKTEAMTGFPNLTHASPKGTRKRWVDRNTGEIFEWDSEKGELEKYNKKGKHLGSFDPYSGAQRGEAQSNRSIEP